MQNLNADHLHILRPPIPPEFRIIGSYSSNEAANNLLEATRVQPDVPNRHRRRRRPNPSSEGEDDSSEISNVTGRLGVLYVNPILQRRPGRRFETILMCIGLHLQRCGLSLFLRFQDS